VLSAFHTVAVRMAGLAAAAAAAGIAPALAQTPGQPAMGGTAGLSGLALAAVVVAVGGCVVLDRRRAAAVRRADRLEQALAGAPVPWLSWPARAAPPALADVLRLAGDGAAEAADEDRTAVADALARLSEAGAPMRVPLTLAGGTRTVEIVGRRIDSADGAPNAVWVEDATERRRAAADAAAALAERDAALFQRQATLAAAEARAAQAASVFDALPLPMWLRAPDLSLVWMNRACAAAVGTEPGEALAAQKEFAGGAIGEGDRALARQAVALGQAQTVDRHVVMGGERRLVAITEAPLGEDGAVLGYAVDRTAVEQVQAERDRHIAAHAEVLENMQSAIAIFGPDKRLKFHNQAYVSLWGFDESWLESQPTLGEILEDLRERRRLPEHADFRAFKRDQINLFTSLIRPEEDLLHLPDGTTLRSLVTPHPFGGLMVVLEDVTSALNLERNYNTLMAVQKESLDNLAEGIAVYGSDGRLQLSNPAFEKIWGLDAADLDGHPHIAEVLDRTRRFFEFEDWAKEREAMMAWALDREPANGRMIRADGSILEYSTVPLPDGAVLNSYLDVTDSAKVEQALRASNQALETADRLKSEFIANVSYQLRTPLNAIMGFAEILDKQYFGPLNHRQREYTSSIVDASRRLLSLINDILDIATIEAGYMALELKQVDVAELLRGVHDLTQEWAGKQELLIAIDCPADVGAIEADERRLKQALYNLVSNAVKFTPPGGQITLSAWRRDGEAGLLVRDTGIGIPEADQERVFGRFERGHPHLRQSGVGLGLALVKSFIEMHGGRIELESELGAGTTVICILPAHPIVAYTDATRERAARHTAAGD